nr:hypothetical protein [Tanacetum cinerariifolium]
MPNSMLKFLPAYEANKIILDTYGETVTIKRRRDDESDKEEGPFAGSDRGLRDEEKVTANEFAFAEEPVQTTCQMDEPSDPMFETGADDQPIVQSSQHSDWFSQPKKPPTPDHDWNKTLPALKVDILPLELLAGPTFDLMKGSCTSLIELEYHLEEVYKATTDQLDCVYGFAVNQESALDVYSKWRIIAVMDLKIMKWHSYKHLDWIMVRRDDDKLYKLKEGDF